MLNLLVVSGNNYSIEDEPAPFFSTWSFNSKEISPHITLAIAPSHNENTLQMWNLNNFESIVSAELQEILGDTKLY